MIARNRVRDSRNKTVGFILEDGSFYTDYFVKSHIDVIENLKIRSDGIIVSETELPIKTYKSIINKIYNGLDKSNPFVRDIQSELLEWKRDKLHKVLQLKGARQTGKTTELKKFAYKNYEYVIYVNISKDVFGFEETVINNGCFTLCMEEYCRQSNLPSYVNSNKTLLIIDEIQTSSSVYNTIRTLYGRLSCDIIVAGSYLGHTLNSEFFLPAGTITFLEMLPLSFKEFCRVFGKDKLLGSVDLFGGGESRDYEELYMLYKIYRKIGGYPEVVKTYLEYKDINRCYRSIHDMLVIFENESGVYFENSKDTLVFNTVYTQAVKDMCSEKRGSGSNLVDKVTALSKDSLKMLVSRDEVSKAIQWLIYSGILGVCDLINKEVLPARRLFYLDCGLASYLGLQTDIADSSLRGMVSETFVYSELYRLYSPSAFNKKVRGRVPCFGIFGQYELDFILLAEDGCSYGIEVKTNKGTVKSLDVFLDKKLVNKGIVAKNTKGGSEKYTTIPIYAVGCRFPYS